MIKMTESKTGRQLTVTPAALAPRISAAVASSIVVPAILADAGDRALISVMTFAFARIGAVVAMRVEDYYPKGKRWWVRLHEKGGKRHEMPAHHNLEQYLDTYIEAAGIGDSGKSPLFRSAIGRACTLAATAMNRVDAWRMIQRPRSRVGVASQDRLPHLPRNGHYRVPRSRRYAGERPGHGRAREPANDQALRPHRR